MPRYIVKLASQERLWEEELWAPSPDYIKKSFARRGIAVLSVKEKFTLRLRRKLTLQDRMVFAQEFMALVRAGLPLGRALEIIQRRTGRERLKEILSDVIFRIEEGASLSQAFKPYWRDFGMIFIASLAAGERSGRLAETLARYLDYVKLMDETSRAIRAAITYPAVVITVAMMLVFILVVFVLPNFAEFYKGAEISLPALTVLLLQTSTLLKGNLPLLFLSVVAAAGLLRLLRRYDWFRRWLHGFYLRLPFVGKALYLMNLSVYLRTLAFLLSGGTPMLQACRVAAETVANLVLRERLEQVVSDVEQGDSLSSAFDKTGIIPEMAVEMARVGENAGNLEELLEQTSAFLDQEMQFKIKRWIAVLEPALIVTMGVIVAIMLLSVYLPIFQLARGMR